MPINTLEKQRRTYQVGRIRLGVQIPLPNKPGKFRPAKLGVLRFTSRDEVAMRRIGELYGGEVRQWQDAPTDDQWEVITEAREIDCLVPPGPFAVSQWMEMWSGGGCMRRCDGDEEKIRCTPCLCPANEEDRADLAQRGQACKPTTRVSLILLDVPTLGVWRLDSHGWNAAHELGGTAELMRALMESRTVVPAVLRLEKRQVVSKGKTKDFVVPVLALRDTARAMIEGTVGGGRIELPPAPVNLRAIEGAIQRQVEAPAVPDAPQVPAAPTTAREMAAAAELCEDPKRLVELGREALRREWMDTYVPSKYAPADDEDIELVEVFRGRQAELEDDAP